MSLFDELQDEVSKRSGLARKRKQIEGLRKKAQEGFNAQFLLKSSNPEQAAFLKGKIEAFNECLEVLKDKEDRPGPGKQHSFDGML